MIRLMRTLLWVVALHFAAFLCFPDTGSWGLPFTGISLVVCTVAALTSFTFVSPFFLVSTWFGRLYELGVVLIVAFALGLLLPQESGNSPLAQLIDGDYPTRESVDRGLSKLGLTGDRREAAAGAAEKKIRKELKR